MTNDTQTAEIVRARRERLIKFHLDYIAELREAAPTWVDLADDMSETLFDPAACELLAETAPDDGYLRGYWTGRGVALRELQALTQRETATS